MDTLVAFYKIHYNFAAISILILMWAFFLIIRGNVKWFLIVFVALGSYNLAMKHAIETNPAWFDQIMQKVSSFDFVDQIWGGSAVSSQKTNSENRMNQ
jgi:hypothetical protein